MKDHEFREHVNDLRSIVIVYGHTQQLRSRLHSFLLNFKEKCK